MIQPCQKKAEQEVFVYALAVSSDRHKLATDGNSFIGRKVDFSYASAFHRYQNVAWLTNNPRSFCPSRDFGLDATKVCGSREISDTPTVLVVIRLKNVLP